MNKAGEKGRKSNNVLSTITDTHFKLAWIFFLRYLNTKSPAPFLRNMITICVLDVKAFSFPWIMRKNFAIKFVGCFDILTFFFLTPQQRLLKTFFPYIHLFISQAALLPQSIHINSPLILVFLSSFDTFSALSFFVCLKSLFSSYGHILIPYNSGFDRSFWKWGFCFRVG